MLQHCGEMAEFLEEPAVLHNQAEWTLKKYLLWWLLFGCSPHTHLFSLLILGRSFCGLWWWTAKGRRCFNQRMHRRCQDFRIASSSY
jgi:hypothetical protein